LSSRAAALEVTALTRSEAVKTGDTVGTQLAGELRRIQCDRLQLHAAASLWQNGFAERLIGSIRRECVDHIIVLGEAHLRRILKSYADCYIGVRAHRSLNKDAFSLSTRSGVTEKPE
jgi:Integrase core domain